MNSIAPIEMIKHIDALPALPEHYLAIKKVIASPEYEMSALVRAIRPNQTVSATILKCVNSTFFNPVGAPIADISKAIARLGLRQTERLALTSALMDDFGTPTSKIKTRTFWAHAYAVALICEQSATALHLNPEEMFSTGLFHDIGHLIQAIICDASFFEDGESCMSDAERHAAEIEHCGISHAELGAALLQQWNLPESLCQAVAAHHDVDSDILPARLCHMADNESLQIIGHETAFSAIESLIKERFTPCISEVLSRYGLSSS
ncbi:HDOD domain-containing protein [Mariprofundus erugo]|uniref:HDOD domain-containing protein n=1 Tax=Mariprofundus erugo TaxID=2528639 RepID=A0A5R9GQC9_9PROT|nr:HDOD domain-containing protein [Mariprofundus erugo]TLS68496.1 HDOD domain-containing protein [Mariprofundus erugo]TLS76854.1 HDOD domain-containing protein [Mariprofundus erugo]